LSGSFNKIDRVQDEQKDMRRILAKFYISSFIFEYALTSILKDKIRMLAAALM